MAPAPIAMCQPFCHCRPLHSINANALVHASYEDNCARCHLTQVTVVVQSFLERAGWILDGAAEAKETSRPHS